MAKTQKQSREEVRERCLLDRSCILEFIRRNGEVNTDRILAVFGYPRAMVNTWLHEMEQTGHVVVRQEKGNRIRNFWMAGENKTPLANFRRHDPTIRQVFVKAKQIGMKRDLLVAALFGEAVRA